VEAFICSGNSDTGRRVWMTGCTNWIDSPDSPLSSRPLRASSCPFASVIEIAWTSVSRAAASARYCSAARSPANNANSAPGASWRATDTPCCANATSTSAMRAYVK
jgi:hypothetical protein